MLDVVGFDTATPQLISDFARRGDLSQRKEGGSCASMVGTASEQLVRDG
jgi:hypothetical protein